MKLLQSALIFSSLFLTSGALIAEPSFKIIQKTDVVQVEIDENSIHREKDEDGDTMSGAVVRITPAKPIANGPFIVGKYENTVIAVCGFDGMVVADSKIYNPANILIGRSEQMVPIAVKPGEKEVSNIVYEYLCKGIARKPKAGKDPSYI